LGEVKRLPTFIHVVRPWRPHKDWKYSKYQVPPGWGRPDPTDGILECFMPMLAPPPSDLLLSAKADKKMEAWTLCIIYHAINSMLMKHKLTRCAEGFNAARILKIGDQWLNYFVQDHAPSITRGASPSWVKNCALQCNCPPLDKQK